MDLGLEAGEMLEGGRRPNLLLALFVLDADLQSGPIDIQDVVIGVADDPDEELKKTK